MKNMKMKEFITYIECNGTMDARLARAMVRQVGGWDEFRERARDIATHGGNCGFDGLIYYSEMIPFANNWKNEIMDLCRYWLEQIGEYNTVSELIASFNCLNGDYSPMEIEGVLIANKIEDGMLASALTWLVAEELARAYIYLVEGD